MGTTRNFTSFINRKTDSRKEHNHIKFRVWMGIRTWKKIFGDIAGRDARGDDFSCVNPQKKKFSQKNKNFKSFTLVHWGTKDRADIWTEWWGGLYETCQTWKEQIQMTRGGELWIEFYKI